MRRLSEYSDRTYDTPKDYPRSFAINYDNTTLFAALPHPRRNGKTDEKYDKIRETAIHSPSRHCNDETRMADLKIRRRAANFSRQPSYRADAMAAVLGCTFAQISCFRNRRSCFKAITRYFVSKRENYERMNECTSRR